MFTIYTKLGGRDAVLDLIEKSRSDRKSPRPTEFAEAAWRAKGALPGSIVTVLMEECERRGVPYSLADFRAPRDQGAAA